MLQIQAPSEVLRLLQSQATLVAHAKCMKDVQNSRGCILMCRNLKRELSVWHRA